MMKILNEIRSEFSSMLSAVVFVLFAPLPSTSFAHEQQNCNTLDNEEKLSFKLFRTLPYSGRVAVRRGHEIADPLPVWLLEPWKCIEIKRDNFLVGRQLLLIANNTITGVTKNNYLAVQTIRWWENSEHKDFVSEFNPKKLVLFRNVSDQHDVWERKTGQTDINIQDFKIAKWWQSFLNYHDSSIDRKQEDFEALFGNNQWHSKVKGRQLSTWDRDKRKWAIVENEPKFFEGSNRVIVRDMLVSFVANRKSGKGVEFHIGVGNTPHLEMKVRSSASDDFYGRYSIIFK